MYYIRSAFLGLVTAILLTVAGCGGPAEDPGDKGGVGGQYQPTSQFDLGPNKDQSAQVDDMELGPNKDQSAQVGDMGFRPDK